MVQPVRSGDGFAAPELMVLDYPSNDPASMPEYFGMSAANSGAPQPRGRGLHNHHFVQQLRNVLLQEPNVDFVEGSVTDVIMSDTHPDTVVGVQWRRRVSSGADEYETLSTHAPFVVLCDGYFSGLRKVRPVLLRRRGRD